MRCEDCGCCETLVLLPFNDTQWPHLCWCAVKKLCALSLTLTLRYFNSHTQLINATQMACVGPGHCCYRMGPFRFLAGWHKRRSWTRVSLVLL